MRWRPSGPWAWSAAAIPIIAAAGTGCSAGGPPSPTAAVNPSSTAAAPTESRVIATSPAGVTTKIDVPAHSTEEEYFQACHAATLWMHDHPGDRQTLFERYLAAVQTPGVVGPGTWNIAWSVLPLARQAGVIVAAHAAADNECG